MRECLRTSWTKPLIGTKLLREFVVAGMSCSDWGNIWAVVVGNEIDDEGEQGDVRVEEETGEGS